MNLQPNPPVIIIGAARSGTNMLRNVLCTLPSMTTWPCDEIPFIWRHGNRRHPDDEFTPDMARPEVITFIQGAFSRIRGQGSQIVVEKTCANSLRLGFVMKVMPEARILVISRHGPDAIASAMKRWTAGFDLRYSMAKARFVPLSDLPGYAASFLRNRVARLASPDRRLPVWGPVFKGMRELPDDLPLAELAALQWQRSVQLTESHLQGVSENRYHRVRYEDFVAAPASSLQSILEFLQHPVDGDQIARATADVRCSSVGKSARSLSPSDKAHIERTLKLAARDGLAAEPGA